MAILLSWKSANSEDTTIKVYRSSTGPISTSNLPQPLAELPGNARQYEDTTAVGGATYNYLVEITNGKDRIYTAVPQVLHIKQRGPGSSLLLQGDHECGYYGTVDALALPNIFESFPYNSTNVTSLNTIPQQYHKFAWKGRVLFIGDRQIMFNAAALAHARKYVRSGLKWNFESEIFANDVPNIVTKNGFSYHARAPRSSPEDWDGVLPIYHRDVASNPDTEFNQLIGALWVSPPPVKLKLSGLQQVVYSHLNSVICADPRAAVAETNRPDVINARTVRVCERSGDDYDGDASMHTTAPIAHHNANHFEDTRGWFTCATRDSGAIYIWPVFEMIEDAE